MKYPKKVYAIFPYGPKGETAGVYVGISNNIKARLKNHRYSQAPELKELHELMRNNGYSYQVFDEVPQYRDGRIEYDWIDFFLKKSDLKVFNNRTGVCNADYKRVVSRITLEKAKMLKSAIGTNLPLEELFEQTK